MISLSDTTLRDGAQAEGVSFSMDDKIRIIQALDDLGIRYIEAGNPGANVLDAQLFSALKALPKLRCASLLAFGSTCRPGLRPEEDEALCRLRDSGADISVIFGKSGPRQSERILRISPEDNLRLIADTVQFLKKNGTPVWYDAEHFFDAWRKSRDYAMKTLDAAAGAGAARLILCDTRGGSFPEEIAEAVAWIRERTDTPLGIHCHNDMGMAVACSVAAVRAGCDLVQGTVGGIGERCGNMDLCTMIPILELKMNEPCLPAGNLTRLTHLSREILEILNLVPDEHAPFVGHSAFAHKAGMHIDGVIKDSDSYEHIDPEAVGNQRRFLLSDQAGRAGIYARLGHILPDLNRDSAEITAVIRRIKEMELKGYTYENADGSFELMALDTLGRRKHYFRVADYHVLCQQMPGSAERAYPSAQAYLKINVNGQDGINAAEGDGPVNALDQALRKTLSLFYPSVSRMSLKDFKVRVLNSEGTASRVRVSIESSDGSHIWNTVGVSENIIEACLIALIDSVDYMLTKYVPDDEISSAILKKGE